VTARDTAYQQQGLRAPPAIMIAAKMEVAHVLQWIQWRQTCANQLMVRYLVCLKKQSTTIDFCESKFPFYFFSKIFICVRCDLITDDLCKVNSDLTCVSCPPNFCYVLSMTDNSNPHWNFSRISVFFCFWREKISFFFYLKSRMHSCWRYLCLE